MNLKKILLSASRFNKKLIALSSDFFSICLSTLFALVISNVELSSLDLKGFMMLSWIPLLTVIVFWYFGVYRTVVRYIDLSVIFILSRAIFVLLILSIVSKALHLYLFSNLISSFPGSVISVEGWLVGFITFDLSFGIT